MTSISGVNSTASLILQQFNAVAAPPEGEDNSVNLAAITNGLSAKSGVTGPEAQAQSKITDTLSAASLTQLKMQLFKRVGMELGVKEEDYATPQLWAAALRQAVSAIRAQKNGDLIIKGIEHDLGLDKLGVSLDTVIDAIGNPGSSAGKALDDALKKAIAKGDIAIDGGEANQQGAVQISEIGMYSPAKL
ncbi:MAG: hypothetical protein ACLPX9_03415 [Rhodomicrobium sp.]